MGYSLCICKKCNMIDDTSNLTLNENGECNHNDENKCWKNIKYSYEDADNALNSFIVKRYISQKLLPPSMFFNLDDTQEIIKDVCNKLNIKYKGRGMSHLTFHKHFYECIDYIVLNQYEKAHTEKFKQCIECIDYFMY